MIRSILIPCGVSSSPIPDPSLPNLRYVVTDSFFTLGISRSPGADWITDILLTTNNYLLFVSVPYLVSSILSILLLMAYLRKKTSGRILGAGLFAVIVTVMLVPLVVSVFVVPLTPILAFLITFWTNNLRFAQEEKDESHME